MTPSQIASGSLSDFALDRALAQLLAEEEASDNEAADPETPRPRQSDPLPTEWVAPELNF